MELSGLWCIHTYLMCIYRVYKQNHPANPSPETKRIAKRNKGIMRSNTKNQAFQGRTTRHSRSFSLSHHDFFGPNMTTYTLPTVKWRSLNSGTSPEVGSIHHTLPRHFWSFPEIQLPPVLIIHFWDFPFNLPAIGLHDEPVGTNTPRR